MFRRNLLPLLLSVFMMIFLLLGCGSLSGLVNDLRTDGVDEISDETIESGDTSPEESTKDTATSSEEVTSTSEEESEVSETQQGNSEYLSPDFTLESLTGENITLSDFVGHIVVLNFWATWCPPCKAEIPDFQKAWDKYKGKGVVFLGVSIDQNRSDVESYIKDSGVTYTILLDLTNQVASLYGINAIPTTFILDENGSILFNQVGGMTIEQLSTQIEGALK